jgi:hypothetical protein
MFTGLLRDPDNKLVRELDEHEPEHVSAAEAVTP